MKSRIVMLGAILGCAFTLVAVGCNKQVTEVISTSSLTEASTYSSEAMVIDPSGGTIEIPGPEGFEKIIMDVPEGSFTKKMTFSIRLEDTDQFSLPESISPIMPLITVDGISEYSSQPITLTIPVNTNDGSIYAANYLNKQTKELSPIALLYGDDEVKLLISHFSSILISEVNVSGSDDNVKKEASSGFKPGLDDWRCGNNATVISSGGQCAATSITMLWYYLNRLERDDLHLYGLYDNDQYKTPLFKDDDCFPFRLNAVLQDAIENESSLVDKIGRYYKGIAVKLKSLTAKSVFHSITNTLNEQKKPVLIYMVAQDINAAHLCLAYRFEGNNIYIADPNKPGDQNNMITFVEGNDQAYFKDYESAGHVCNNFMIMDSNYFISDDKIQEAWADLDARTVGYDEFPEYTLQYKTADGTFQDISTSIEIAKDSKLILKGNIKDKSLKPLIFKLYKLEDNQKVVSLTKEYSESIDLSIIKPGIYGIWISTSDLKRNLWLDFKWFTIKITAAATPTPTTAALFNGALDGYIYKVYQSDERYFLEFDNVDLIDPFTERKTLIAALKEDGFYDDNYTEDENIEEYFELEYRRNRDKTVQTFELAENAELLLELSDYNIAFNENEQSDLAIAHISISVDKFMDFINNRQIYFEGEPFLSLFSVTVKDNKIIKAYDYYEP